MMEAIRGCRYPWSLLMRYGSVCFWGQCLHGHMGFAAVQYTLISGFRENEIVNMTNLSPCNVLACHRDLKSSTSEPSHSLSRYSVYTISCLPWQHFLGHSLQPSPAFVRFTTCATGWRMPLFPTPSAVPLLQPIFSSMARPLFCTPSSGAPSPTTSPSR